MRHWYRGMIDSDGGWSIRKRKEIKQICCSFVSPVESFIYKFRNCLMKICNLSEVKIIPNPYNTCYQFSYEGNIQCKKIYDYLYNDGGPWLERKYKLTTEHFNNYKLIKI